MSKSEFQCPVCGDERKNRKLLQRHLQWHERSKVALVNGDDRHSTRVTSVLNVRKDAVRPVCSAPSTVSDAPSASCLPAVDGDSFRMTASRAIMKLKASHERDVAYLSTPAVNLVRGLKEQSTGLTEKELTIMILTAKFFAGTEKPRRRVIDEAPGYVLHHIEDIPLVGPSEEYCRPVLPLKVLQQCPAAPARPRISARKRNGASACRRLFSSTDEDFLAMVTTPEPPSSPELSVKATEESHRHRRLPVGCRIVKRRASDVSALFESPSPPVNQSSAKFIMESSSAMLFTESSPSPPVDQLSAKFVMESSSAMPVSADSFCQETEFQFPDFAFLDAEL